MNKPQIAKSLLLILGLATMVVMAASSQDQVSALADAVESRDQALIRRLLDERAQVNAAQVDAMTALHWAVYHDDSELAAVLVRAGADVNANNRYGVSPLSLAAAAAPARPIIAAASNYSATVVHAPWYAFPTPRLQPSW